MRFSANLGFLWADRPLAHAIHAAADAGFDAVECHWPFAAPASEVSAALATTGLPMIGLNTSPGDRAAGEFGLAALPGREGEARAAIDEAIAYAAAVGARHVHVMAGHAEGPAAEDAFLVNLDHACRAAAPRGIGILIEPLNRHDAPGYFLATTGQAEALIDRLGAPNLRLMFDCYHVQQDRAHPVRLRPRPRPARRGRGGLRPHLRRDRAARMDVAAWCGIPAARGDRGDARLARADARDRHAGRGEVARYGVRARPCRSPGLSESKSCRLATSRSMAKARCVRSTGCSPGTTGMQAPRSSRTRGRRPTGGANRQEAILIRKARVR